MKENETKAKLSGKEITWLVISFIFLATALTFIAFHFIAAGINASGVEAKYNLLLQADKAMISATKLGWLYWGLVALLVGVIILIITLEVFARKNEKSVDKDRRRKDKKTFNISEDSVRDAVQVEEGAVEKPKR